MENKCPKCGIDLTKDCYSNIKIRDENRLAIRLLFGEVSLTGDSIYEGCDLCGATPIDKLMDKVWLFS